LNNITRLLLETALVEDLVRVVWRLGRVAPIEAGILQEGHHQECLRAARSGSASEELAMLIDPPTAGLAARQQVQAAKEAFEAARAMSVTGFLEDARGANMLDKLARYEMRLESRLYRLVRELDHLHAQRVEGEIVE